MRPSQGREKSLTEGMTWLSQENNKNNRDYNQSSGTTWSSCVFQSGQKKSRNDRKNLLSETDETPSQHSEKQCISLCSLPGGEEYNVNKHIQKYITHNTHILSTPIVRQMSGKPTVTLAHNQHTNIKPTLQFTIGIF